MTARRFGHIILAVALASMGLAAQAPRARRAARTSRTASPAAIPTYKELKYPPLKQVKVPDVPSITLSNGMRVFMLEDHELPLVSGFALVRTGNLFDPDEKRGLAELTADVMRTGGTSKYTGDELDEMLENMAASVESNMGESTATVSFSALKENAGQVLEIFKGVLTDPEFRQDKVDLIKAQSHSTIARRNDEASEISGRELTSILYGRDNSYGWTVEHEHINRIQREDLQQFYHRYYVPKNIMLGIYGDFSSADMKDKLEALFKDWTVEQPPVPPFPAVTTKPVPGVFYAEKTDVTQAFFSMGHLGGKLSDPDYPALEVTGHILGSGFNSRLMSQIRTKLGLAYSIGAGWGAAYDHPGIFRIAGSTKSATATEAVEAARTELEKMRTEEVTELELKTAKDSVLNSFVFFFDSPAKTLNRVLMYEYFGYPRDFLFEYQRKVAAVTRADVLRVAKQYMRPENLTIVVTGNAKDFGKPLSDIGKVEQIDLSIPEPK